MKTGKKESETLENILAYIDMTLEETGLKREDLIKHFNNCPFCRATIIECPFCHSSIPVGYQCLSCRKVLPLETLLEQIAKQKLG